MFENLKLKIYKALDNPDRRKLSQIDFKKALQQMYDQGFLAAERIGQERIENREHDIKEEYNMLFSMKEVELEQMNKVVAEYRAQVNDARKAYRSYYHETITNKKLIAQIATQIRNLFNSSGEIFKSFVNIQDAAKTHFQTMLKHDPLNRNLLGLTISPEDIEKVHKNQEYEMLEDELKEIEEDIKLFVEKDKKIVEGEKENEQSKKRYVRPGNEKTD